jgi:glutaredoxin
LSGHSAVDKVPARPPARQSGPPPIRPSVPAAEITVYSKPDCHLCEEAMAALRRLQGELGFTLRELDITADDALHRAYFERIPVVLLDGEELCEFHVSEARVRERLESRR